MTNSTRKTIVAAVDTKGASRSLFKEALVLASSMRAKVVVVSVTPEYEGNMNRFFIKNAEQQLSSPFKKILEEAASYASSLGLEMETVHRSGKPFEEIIAVAEEEKASLILLGTAKRLQFERMLLGRTTAEIIVAAPCDVLLIPESSEIRFNKILVGIDGCPASIGAGQRALEVAHSYGSEVHAVYIVDIPADRSLRYGVLSDAEKKAADILKKYAAQAQEQGIPVITVTRWNVPEKSLVEYARNTGIHLIILGSQAKPPMFEMFWGSVVERVASLTTCPILVARQYTMEKEEFSLPYPV